MQSKIKQRQVHFQNISDTIRRQSSTDKGVKIDPEKLKAVESMKKTENVRELQTFLEFISFTKHRIKHDLLQTQVLVQQLNFLNY